MTTISIGRSAALPGFRPTMGFTLLYLALIVIIPLAGLPIRTMTMGWSAFWETIADPRVMASFALSLRTSSVAAIVNGVFGLIAAWVLVRYEFPGRKVVDALVDLPFALPTAVAGITLTTLYAPTGWLGRPLAELGLPVAFTPTGITVALVFIGLPFVIRSLQPVLHDLDVEVEVEGAKERRCFQVDLVKWRPEEEAPAADQTLTLCFDGGDILEEDV